MPQILILGAGHSSPFLIQHLLDHSGARVVVADRDRDAAERRVGDHPQGEARGLDLRDNDETAALFAASDLVIHLLPPQLQPTVARLAVEHGCHLVSASYRSSEIEQLHDKARAKGVALMTEMGLDPGIDLMSAQRIISDIQARGGVVDRFLSYGGGLPEPSFTGNPLRYCVTWNPRNVVMAAEHGARYLRKGHFKLEPWNRVFGRTWPVDVPNLGVFDAYANRDSISYRAIHGIERVRTLVRGTLRYPGYAAIWHLMVRLGLPNEHLEIPKLGERTWAELTEMFLPDPDEAGGARGDIKTRVAVYLGLDADDERLAALEWLGLFDDAPIGIAGEHPAEALKKRLEERLPLPADIRDMVVLHHEIDAVFPDDVVERTLSTFIHYGEPAGLTAMAQTVGMPAALGARLLLDGQLTRRGCLSPTDEDVYTPVLAALEAEGLRFTESVERTTT
ncbi:MAG: saccharopine dehydrogenase C-terminal domain-containing protein [Acidobacteriota bacterium]